MSDENHPVILVVEDDPAIHKFLRVSLEVHGYRLVESISAKDGLLQAATRQPEVIILDLGLPDMDGVEFTRQVRQWSSVPIIVVSARHGEQDKVGALDAGADDYLTKPFSVSELQARLRAVLRRKSQAGEKESAVLQVRELCVDVPRHLVKLGEREIHLTPNEYRLLVYLMKNAGRVITHQQLLKEIWGPDSTQEMHYLRVYVNQLRQKIEPVPAQPQYLLTEPGIGYRMLEA